MRTKETRSILNIRYLVDIDLLLRFLVNVRELMARFAPYESCGTSRKYLLRTAVIQFVLCLSLSVKFERAHHEETLEIPRSTGRDQRETGPYKDNEVRGPRRFATSRFVDFFSAGPRYFLRPYLNLHVLVRADRTTFMRKVSVTRPTIIRQFSWPLPALYLCARVHFFYRIRSFR